MARATKKHERYKNTDYLRTLGEHCRKLRKKKGYSINRLSAEGEQLSPHAIIRLEKGTSAVTVTTIIRYAQVLEIHPKKLLDFEFDLDQ